MILAADLGGTKTVLALFDAEAGVERPLREETYPSREYDSLEALVGLFLETTSAKPTIACFGVAGPVINRVPPVTVRSVSFFSIHFKFFDHASLQHDPDSHALMSPTDRLLLCPIESCPSRML